MPESTPTPADQLIALFQRARVERPQIAELMIELVRLAELDQDSFYGLVHEMPAGLEAGRGSDEEIEDWIATVRNSSESVMAVQRASDARGTRR